MNNKLLSVFSIVLGLVFLALAIIYLITPAHSLPHFLPGYSSAVSKTHFKHGVGAFLLSMALFVFAWFKSGKKSV